LDFLIEADGAHVLMRVKQFVALLVVGGVLMHIFLANNNKEASKSGPKPKAWFVKSPKLPKYIYLQDWMEALMAGRMPSFSDLVLMIFLKGLAQRDHIVMPVQNDTAFMKDADMENDLFIGVGYVCAFCMFLFFFKRKIDSSAVGSQYKEDASDLVCAFGTRFARS
jgi:hypothetical protein